MKHIGGPFKREFDTRWCSKNEAVNAVYVNFDKLIELLNELVSDDRPKVITLAQIATYVGTRKNICT